MTTPAPTAAPSTSTKGNKPSTRRTIVHRESSDASRFHMSKDAVDRSVEDIAKWTDLKCIKHLAEIRWGSFTRVGCPHCASTGDHYWSRTEKRWRCNICRKKFSVTSQTMFAYRKLPLQKILAAIHLWASGAAGVPALQLRRMLNIGGYTTAFVLGSKLREGLLRGFNTGLISGLVEMDAAHASGRRASEKRGRPQTFRVTGDEDARADALLTVSARQKQRRDEKLAAIAAGGIVHPEHGGVFPSTRRMVFTLRRRDGAKGKGAMMTRIGVGMTESPEVAQAFVDAYVAKPESVLSTDTGTAFKKVGKEFKLHLQVNHSETLVGPQGQHVNNSEGFTARQDRSEKGVYLNIEPKYLSDYAIETAFREDHRRLATGATADRATFWALNVGISHFWVNFTHGQHRDYEIQVLGDRPAKASGPDKGNSPNSSANGRAPR